MNENGKIIEFTLQQKQIYVDENYCDCDEIENKSLQVRHLNGNTYGNTFVQSFINNIAFPKTLDELQYYINVHGCYNVEDILTDSITTWTSPKWAKIGDVVFFMHSKTAKSTITSLRTQLNNRRNEYSNKDYSILMNWINRGLELYRLYGGKIYALGRVIGVPQIYEDIETYYHWKSRIYADISVDVLENPIDISEFNSFITVSRQSGITGVWGKEFDTLIHLIASKNDIPQNYLTCVSAELPISKITNDNWMQLPKEYRYSFMLESQFRSFYVDYLLKSIGDKKIFYSECMCCKPGMPNSFVDNVILFNGMYLPVEVKLSVATQTNIKSQVVKYTNNTAVFADKKMLPIEKMYKNNVLIVDTYCIYIYSAKKDEVEFICSLDDLTSIIAIEKLKKLITEKLFN